MKKISFIVFLLCIGIPLRMNSQSKNNWSVKNLSEASKASLKLDRKNIPSEYKVLSLDFNSLTNNLKSASKRSQDNKLSNSLILEFPHEDGSMESYSIEKTNVLAPELEAKYPDIQSFYGISTTNPVNKIYISTSPSGFTGLITGEKTIYIDPVSKNDVNNYIVYDRKNCSRNPTDEFVCNAVMDEAISELKTSETTASLTDGNLRTYRLALACTSDYSLYYGNTIPQVLAAMNTTITRVNSIFRRDLSVVFQLVANNDRLIYINGFNIDASPDPDPYDNYNGSGMLSVNTPNITGLIGVNAYDIGHVFSTGGGGIAGTSPCTAASKGNGVTGIVTPQFDPFDIDYVCHEIGHQFSAGHTYYNACFGSKVTDDFETGSASTIMGYAGICAPNVQGNSDAYFHARSIEQMTNAISTHSCVPGVSSGNAAPVVAALTTRTIPRSTPFTLTGSATDVNTSDALTYAWEQYNNDGTFAQPPVSTSTGGPIFRSIMPTTDPSRTFPNLAAIVDNITPTWEVLPSVARTLNFRLTVRDNSLLGGRTNFQALTVNVGTAGPFLVTSPNTGSEVWYTGETRTVTWNVASTNTATYSTTVNIKLSTDGGYTYPITLLSGTANDGTQTITVPDNIGKLNRIKIEAAANIFFDISNANFEIKSGKFEMTSTASTQSVCKPANAVFTINYTPAPTFSETTTFSAIGAPAGSTVTFSPTSRSTAGPFTMTVSNISGVASGNYPITVKGTSATANIDFPVLLNVFDNTIGTVTLASPSNGATNQQTSSLLQWNALSSASSYLVQISTSPTFATITESATVTGTSYQTTSLTQGTINYWRVRPINSCTTGAFSEVYVFQIASDFCQTYSNATFEPNAIWETGSNNAVSAKINIPDNIDISDVNFYMKATHSAINDIKMQFSSPTGIFAEIYNRDCSGSNFDVTFDDSGTVLTCGNAVDPLTNAALEGVQQASQSLSKFNGSMSLGTWTLLATDRGSNAAGGTFTNFSITICGKLQIVNNVALTNNSLQILQGATATISQSNLSATQPSATNSQLIYTVTQLPINGTLKRNNVNMVVGGTFTQTDINNNLLSYTNNGTNSNPDSFKFSVNGNNLALLGGQTFNITVCGAPVPDLASLPDITGQCSVTVTAPTATSNCYGQITGTTSTVFPITTSGTTVITWNFNDGNGQSINVNQNVIIDSTTWNGTSWSNGAPTSTKAALINGNYNVAANITACKLTVNNNAIVTIPSGYNVTLNGALTVSSGSFTLNNNSNLIQSTNVANSGNIIVKRNTNPLMRFDYMAWSSPVLNQGLLNFSPLTSISPTVRFYTFNSATNSYTTVGSPAINTATFDSGKGYLIRLPFDHPTSPTIWTGTFTGQPFNGPKLVTLGNNVSDATKRFNLIGNPYPSTISIPAFASANSANIEPSIYFWRKTNNALSPSYCSYNIVSGIYADNGEAYTENPNGVIQIGQGFLAQAKPGATTVVFDNNQRIANNANQIFRNSNSDSSTTTIESNNFWLNMTGAPTEFSQTVIGYHTNATQGIDDYDSLYFNDGAIAFTSIVNGQDLVIQGRVAPFNASDVVPMKYKVLSAGTYSIVIDHAEGIFSSGDQPIYVKDNLSNSYHNLSTGAYTFTSDAGTFTNRFEIVYQTALSNDVADFAPNSVTLFNQNNIININSGNTTMETVKVFDIRGRLLVEKKNIIASVTQINVPTTNQVLIVEITSVEGIKVVKKVNN